MKTFATVCSGIGAPEVAAARLGWKCLFGADIEPFPNAVRAHRFPGVPNLGDMTRYKEWPIRCECEVHQAKETTFNFNGYEIKITRCEKCGGIRVDVLISGTPCQAFSIAGLRKGMADPRGNLTLTFLGIVERYSPCLVLWENVPGVLSDKTGAFGAFLGGLAELGYGFAYRILDAQYFGVAQRRRRVFVVGHIGGQWQRAAAVLFERESLCGNPPPSRETGKSIAPTISARTKGGGGLGTDFDCDGGRISTATADGFRTAEAIPIQEIGKRQSGTPMNGVGHGAEGDPMFTLQSAAVHGVAAPIAFDEAQITSKTNRTKAEPGLPAGTMSKESRLSVAIGIDGSEVGFALRADASHSGDKGDGGVNTNMVCEVAPCLTQNYGKQPDNSDTNAGPMLVTTLAIRGRGGESNLETREDGLANSILTPAGGRGGIGVGAVAIQETAHSLRADGFENKLIPEIVPTLRAGGNKTGGDRPPGTDVDTCDSLIPEVCSAVTSKWAKSSGGPSGDECQNLTIAFPGSMSGTQRAGAEDLSCSLGAANPTGVATSMAVRRLTPRECERLQGFPDDFTLIEVKPGKMAANGPRYKALGNSMAVPVIEWILRRMDLVDEILTAENAKSAEI
jgi:DNA (cytosine-5)-methyltransferase 1